MHRMRTSLAPRIASSLGFARVGRSAGGGWRRPLNGLGRLTSVLHLHHLTPWHDAAEAVWPDVPVVTNLHGTELLILEQIGQDDAAESDGSRIGSPVWRYADYWAHGCVLPSAARTSSRHRLIMPPARFAFLVSWIA